MRKAPKPKKTVSERIDDFFGIFSPRVSYRRKMYRHAGNAFSSYKGAERNRLRSSWIPGGGSADQDLLSELPSLRERSRDLNRNDGHASGITGTMVTNTVGTGIRPQSRIDRESLGIDDKTAEEFQKKAERSFQKWIPFADATERMNFYEIQQLIDRQILENGEVILLPLMLKDKNRPYMLTFETIEADRLATPSDKRSDKSIRDGVQIGDRGEAVAYWIRKTHPGDLTSRFRIPEANSFVRIPAKNKLGRPNVLHLYPILRPGQTRGVPFFAPVMTMFKDLAEYMEAELVAARIAACFAIFIEKTDPYSAAYNRADKTTGEQRIEEIEPGMMEYLNPGEKISSVAPQRPGGSFEPFVERILRAIGAALGIPYELVTKDFSKTNYSSARAALLEARRYFRSRQEWLAQKLCSPAWEMLLEEAYLKGELNIKNFYEDRLDWVRVRWISPGWNYIDPLKEAKATKEALDSGISSLADEASAQGRDWEETIEQKTREAIKIKDLEEKHGIKIIKDKKSVENNKEETDENN